ncbi:hypothetical protein [Streptomyces humi]
MIGTGIAVGLLTVAALTAATACSSSAQPTPAKGTTAAVASPAAMASTRPTETLEPLLQEALSNVKGKTFTSVIVEFPPNARAMPHRHGQAFVYVARARSSRHRPAHHSAPVQTRPTGPSPLPPLPRPHAKCAAQPPERIEGS